MRVGLDGRELVHGIRTGIGRYLFEVVRGVSKDGWDCIVYADRPMHQSMALPGVKVSVLGTLCTPWWDQVTLPRRLAQDRISTFLSPYYKGPLFAPCPVVLTIHDLFFITYLGRRRLLYDGVMTGVARLYATRATAIIADSEYSKRSIVTRLGISSEKITVIPVPLGNEFHEAPLTDEIRLRYGIMDPYILYVGNFWPHKNLPRLLQAFAGLSGSLRNTFQLVLAGYDQHLQPALQELAGTLGLIDRMLFPGPIADQDLPALYSGSTLFVLPSLEEGFGLPALEAMACGAPVIAANRAAIPEVVGKAAILFDPEDVAAITKAMTEVLTQPDLGATLRRQGLLRSREFSLNRTAGRVLTLLQEVSEGQYQTRRTP